MFVHEILYYSFAKNYLLGNNFYNKTFRLVPQLLLSTELQWREEYARDQISKRHLFKLKENMT